MSQLSTHPLRETMTDAEWAQRCKVSWPIGVEIVGDIATNPPVNFASEVPASHPRHPSNSCKSISATVLTSNPWAKQIAGKHYKDLPIQPAQYAIKNGLGYIEGRVVAYVTRWKEKNGVDDLRKAIHMLELLIHEETQRVAPSDTSAQCVAEIAE